MSRQYAIGSNHAGLGSHPPRLRSRSEARLRWCLTDRAGTLQCGMEEKRTMRSAIRSTTLCAAFAAAALAALDLFRGGTREDCLSRGNRIVTRAIQLAQSHPEFRFLLEDNVFVANFVDSSRGTPELDTLKRLVKEGRIEIAPKWAGIYRNLPRGESQVRNLAYGMRYARQVFGVDPRVAHLGDLPGYTWQYPQILAKTRAPYMVMTRMGPPDLSLFRFRIGSPERESRREGAA